MKKLLIISLIMFQSMFGAYDDNGTDYSNTSVDSWTSEDSLEQLELANEILYILSQSKAGENVNKGVYETFVKELNSGGTTSDVESFSRMVLDVTRESNDSNMIVKFWAFFNDEDEGDQIVRGHMDVSEGISETYPLGKFTLNYGVYNSDSNNLVDESVTICKGLFNVDKGDNLGQSLLQINEDCDDSTYISFLDFVSNTNDSDINGDGEINGIEEQAGYGFGYSKSIELMNNTLTTTEFNLIVGKEHYLRKVNGVLTIKDLNEKFISTYQYGLFDKNTGDKININAGFNIVKSADDSYGYGYVGYDSIWLNNLTNGDIVKKRGSSDGVEYKIFMAPGKLYKNSKAEIELIKLTNTKFQVYDSDKGKNYALTWDSTSQAFKVLGEFNSEWKLVAAVPSRDVSEILNNAYSLWSYALNASVPILVNPDNNSTISYFSRELVTAGEDLNLISLNEKKIDSNAEECSSTGSYSRDNLYKEYNFTIDDMTLRDEGNNVVKLNDSITSDCANSLSQLILEENSADYIGINAKNWDEAEVYYDWQTGTSYWDKFTGLLKSDDTFVEFEKPLKFKPYEHTTSNDENSSIANLGYYSLEYNGSSLNVPWDYDSDIDRYKASINLKSGTTLVSDDEEQKEYVVKATGKDVYFDTVNNNNQTDLNFDNVTIVEEYTGPDFNAELVDSVGQVPIENIRILELDN